MSTARKFPSVLLVLCVAAMLGACDIQAFDGNPPGFTLAAGAGLHFPRFDAVGGPSSSVSEKSEEDAGTGLVWEIETGYGWERFGLRASFSRRYFGSTRVTRTEFGMPGGVAAPVTIHYPALGCEVRFPHSLFGPRRVAYLSADFGGLFVNEDGTFKNLFLGWSAGGGQELFRHVFFEIRNVSGRSGSTMRDIEFGSIQAMFKAVLY